MTRASRNTPSLPLPHLFLWGLFFPLLEEMKLEEKETKINKRKNKQKELKAQP